MKILTFFVLFILLSATGCATIDSKKEETKNISKTEDTTKSTDAENLNSFELDLEKIDGENFSFSDIKGKKHLLVSFWATWCEPCKAELLELAEIYPDFSDNFEFVAIATDAEDMIDKVNQFAIENDIPFPVLIDPSGNTVSKLIPGGDTVPYSIIVDKNGKVVSKHSGYKSGDEESLKKELLELKSK